MPNLKGWEYPCSKPSTEIPLFPETLKSQPKPMSTPSFLICHLWSSEWLHKWVSLPKAPAFQCCRHLVQLSFSLPGSGVCCWIPAVSVPLWALGPSVQS